ncbi:MAG: hypothetical protein ACI8UO_000368 [Verrucomicrobiales bacterium]|jgi:hypothetical protein
MKTQIRLACLAIAGLFLSVAALSAKEKKKVDESWKETVTTTPAGDFPMLDPCSLIFNVSWNGVVKAGQADIDITVAKDGDHPGAIETRARARSTGVARVIWPYTADLHSWVDPKSLRPIYVTQTEADRSKQTEHETKFIGDFVFNKRVRTPLSAPEEGKERVKIEDEEEITERVYETPQRINDLFSSVLYVRSMPLDEDGKTFRMITCPFDGRYLVELTQEGREKFKYQGKQINAVKFDITVSKVMKNESLKEIGEKIKKATVWMSDDELRLPLEIRAEIFVGSVRATLMEHRSLKE